MSEQKQYYGFTVDLRKLVSVLAQDPTCKEEILDGLHGTKEPLTSQLGASNMGETDAPIWYSLFPAAVKGKESGEPNLFYRNNNGTGDRVQMRLRLQPADFQNLKTAQRQYQVAPQPQQGPATSAETLAAVQQLQKDPEKFQKLLAEIAASQGAGQLSTQEQEAKDNGIPSDIAAMLSNSQ